MALRVTPQNAAASAIASVEMEGFTVTADDRALLQRVANGELTAAAAIRSVVQEHSAQSVAPKVAHKLAAR